MAVDQHTKRPAVSRKLMGTVMIAVSVVLFGIVGIRSMLHVQTPQQRIDEKKREDQAREQPGKPEEQREHEEQQYAAAAKAEDARRRELMATPLASAPVAASAGGTTGASARSPLPDALAHAPQIDMDALNAQRLIDLRAKEKVEGQSLAAYEAGNDGGGGDGTGGSSAYGGDLLAAMKRATQLTQLAQLSTAGGSAGAGPGTASKPAPASDAATDPASALVQAARNSSLLGRLMGDGGNVSSANAGSVQAADSSRSVGPMNTKWLQTQTGNAGQVMPGLRATPAESPYTLQETGRIPVVILQGLNSDLPSEIRAMVTEDVYDTITGTHKLICKGSILAANANTDVARGQDRMMIAFTRLLLRGGASVSLGAMSGADTQGYAGVDADVNRHIFQRFGAAFLVALVETVAENNSSDTTISIGSSVSSAGTTGLSQVTQAVLNSNVNIQDTLTVKPGQQMTVVVTRDIVLPPDVTGSPSCITANPS
ncbi:TrbI/VirB10 family protein [Paraburkholderia tropica]|uniref:TrbI/VirB10 family protein n=1 Tax=Paraburkholderia tropica TaxID=92647 RepID=UPI002AB61B7E|nr:TrbI/VirB10 family protein [Paraburkholderia tropica]